MKTYHDLNILKNSKSVCIISHIEPDPDALSSMIVFREFIMDFFKVEKVDLFAEYHGMTSSLCEILDSVKLNLKPQKYDTVVMLDCPNKERLGRFKSLFENTETKIVIDHHATNDFSGEINIVEICSSTCEIVYSIMKSFNYQPNSKQQGKIYAGIITDTNNFTVGAFNNRTFEISGEISENIDKSSIYNAFLANNTLKSMKLLSLAINNLKTYENNQILITHITHEEAKQYDAEHIDMCGIVNQIATINTSKLICFIEPRNDEYYASMRAKKDYDVSQIAKNNGGGGHVGAAAFSTKNKLENIESLILNEFTKQLKIVKTKQSKLFK